LIQGSLSGRTRTIVLATVSPSADHYAKTIKTLQLASKARDIVFDNEDDSEVVQELSDLRKLLTGLSQQVGITNQQRFEHLQRHFPLQSHHRQRSRRGLLDTAYLEPPPQSNYQFQSEPASPQPSFSPSLQLPLHNVRNMASSKYRSARAHRSSDDRDRDRDRDLAYIRDQLQQHSQSGSDRGSPHSGSEPYSRSWSRSGSPSPRSPRSGSPRSRSYSRSDSGSITPSSGAVSPRSASPDHDAPGLSAAPPSSAAAYRAHVYEHADNDVSRRHSYEVPKTNGTADAERRAELMRLLDHKRSQRRSLRVQLAEQRRVVSELQANMEDSVRSADKANFQARIACEKVLAGRAQVSQVMTLLEEHLSQLQSGASFLDYNQNAADDDDGTNDGKNNQTSSGERPHSRSSRRSSSNGRRSRSQDRSSGRGHRKTKSISAQSTLRRKKNKSRKYDLRVNPYYDTSQVGTNDGNSVPVASTPSVVPDQLRHDHGRNRTNSIRQASGEYVRASFSQPVSPKDDADMGEHTRSSAALPNVNQSSTQMSPRSANHGLPRRSATENNFDVKHDEEEQNTTTTGPDSSDGNNNLRGAASVDVNMLANSNSAKSTTVAAINAKRPSSPATVQRLEAWRTKRRHIRTEMVSTERAYVSFLHNVLKLYVRPLVSDKELQKKLRIKESEAKLLFGNLEALANYHVMMYNEFMQREASIVLLNNAKLLPLYHAYVTNYDAALNMHDKLKRNKAFVEWHHHVRHTADTNRLKLPDYLMMPIQRLPRYRMLLEQLLRYTPADHITYRTCSDALELIEQMANSVNDKRVRGVQFAELLSQENKLSELVRSMMVPGREVIKYGELARDKGKGKRRKYTMVLFSDALMWTSLSTHKFKGIEYLYDATVMPVPGSPNEMEVVFGNSTKMRLQADSKLAFQEWFDAVHTSIQQSKSNVAESPVTRARNASQAALNLQPPSPQDEASLSPASPLSGESPRSASPGISPRSHSVYESSTSRPQPKHRRNGSATPPVSALSPSAARNRKKNRALPPQQRDFMNFVTRQRGASKDRDRR
jgi:RhoGEF domain